ncbi:hypothetical protein BGZ83_011301 [Gryganskiella cystojenkinii]|nr:hypothetical protein BGZ83_011301 [Gryganskiella cystojenkinii]
MASFFSNNNNNKDNSPFNSPVASPAPSPPRDNNNHTTRSPFRARLARTQTPVPAPFQFDLLSQDSNDADEEDNEDDDGDNHLQQSNNQDLINIDSDDDEDEEEKEHKVRTDTGVIDLTNQSSSPVLQYASILAPPSPRVRAISPTIALQADNKSKRVRLSPGAESQFQGKRVRFDMEQNCIYHYDSSGSVSPPSDYSIEPPRRQRKQPRQQQPLELSLANTSQDVLDFASSLNRLMGGGAGSSQESSFSSTPSPSSSQGSGSPLRMFAFQASPPSPDRRFFSYSPPPMSSLSSCWSPIVSDEDEDEDSDEDNDEEEEQQEGDEDVSMQLVHKPVFEDRSGSPPMPPSSSSPSTSSQERPRFVPRRPRDTTNRFSPTFSSPPSTTIAVLPSSESSSSQDSSNKPAFVPRRPRDNTNLFAARSSPGAVARFPSTLKREASHASFLVTAPQMLERSPSPQPQRRSPSPIEAAQVAAMMSTQSSPPSLALLTRSQHQEINIPALTKSLSDLSSSSSIPLSPPDSQLL